MSRRFSLAEKEQLAIRANRCCGYCFSQADFYPDPFCMEHIFPLVKGGANDLANIAYSCTGCNVRKAAKIESKDIVTHKLTPLYNPRVDNWRDHFQWSEDFLIIIGVSPKGRATVGLLDLN